MGLCASVVVTEPNPNQIDSSHFEYGKVVGKGGFGKVHAAMRVLNLADVVAIKRIEKRRVLEAGVLDSIWTERNVMSRVRSPFLLNLLHAFQSEHELFLVMPLLRGGDLNHYLEVHGPMPDSLARIYCAEIVLALEDLHSLGIAYRDLKPHNLLLNENGHLALSDFGLCVELKPEMDFSTTGSAGTPGFMAPEVMFGRRYSVECDYFSLGVTMHALLTGSQQLFGPTGNDFSSRLHWGCMSPEAIDLVSGLLSIEPSKRLGCRLQDHLVPCSDSPSEPASDIIQPPDVHITMQESELKAEPVPIVGVATTGETWQPKCHADLASGWAIIKRHPFFQGVDWEKLARQEVDSPYKPSLKVNEVHCSNRASL